MTQVPRGLLGFSAILFFGIAGAPSAWADNCTGYDASTNLSLETLDLGHGLKQTSVRSTSILISENSIFNMLAGECAGTILQTEDGKTQAAGYCSRRDKDGDTESISWHQDPGAEKGEWKATGGTGKFAGKEDNKGWYQAVFGDGKHSITRWGGVEDKHAAFPYLAEAAARAPNGTRAVSQGQARHLPNVRS